MLKGKEIKPYEINKNIINMIWQKEIREIVMREIVMKEVNWTWIEMIVKIDIKICLTSFMLN